ncbi:MAG: response regulator [Pirellulales bacterium]
MSDVVRVLLVDDDQDDYLLTSEQLRDAFGARLALAWEGSYEAGLQALREREFDVCLLDFRLGARTGLDLLNEAVAAHVETPIILLTGQGEREVDLQVMQAGAADYLTKDQLSSGVLERAIRHAQERHRDRRALRQLNDLLESRVAQRTKQLEEANRALMLADHRKDEFLAVLAHELRNPLAPITNSLTLLKYVTDDEAVRHEALETMERQLRQLVRLTEDLFEVSRISRGKVELRRESIELADIVHQATEAAHPLYAMRNQTLEVRLPESPMRLKADGARLAQVVSNLLTNASKFTPREGRVELSVSLDGGEVVLRVRDDGIGIAPDQLHRIFEMFAQVGSALERSEAGLGIGLTLVKNLVEMHGGSVVARSQGLGQGSEFEVRLPLESRTAKAGKSRTSQDDETLTVAGRRILVVDDNRDAARSLARLLEIAGHEVATAHNGHSAIAAVGDHKPEMVLLDIGLPDVNGYEVATRLRSDPAHGGLMIVALTGWGQEADRLRAKEAGFNHHLLKPVEYRELTRLIAELPQAR